MRLAAVDLPGHGGSHALTPGLGQHSSEATAAAVAALLTQTWSREGQLPRPPAVVGYSMGARLALHLALRHGYAVGGCAAISGSAGIQGATARAVRAARDADLAQALQAGGAAAFCRTWYQQPLFTPFAAHPRFARAEAARAPRRHASSLALSLAGMSPGLAPDLWAELRASPQPQGGAPRPLLLVAGALDSKFVAAATAMAAAAGPGFASRVSLVPDCGHAVHLEAPEALVLLLGSFLRGAAFPPPQPPPSDQR